MIYPSADELDARMGSKYGLVIAVAKRARQLRDGALPLVDSTSSNTITIALEEIASGKLNIYTPTPEEQAAREEQLAAPRERDRGIAEAVDLLRAPVEEAGVETGEEQPEAESAEEPKGESAEEVAASVADADAEEAESPGEEAPEEEEPKIVEE